MSSNSAKSIQKYFSSIRAVIISCLFLIAFIMMIIDFEFDLFHIILTSVFAFIYLWYLYGFFLSRKSSYRTVFDEYEDLKNAYELSADLEKELKIREDQINFIISKLPIALWMTNAEGIFVLSEGAGLNKIGFKPEDINGHSIFDIYSDQPKIIQGFKNALNGKFSSQIIQLSTNITFENHMIPHLIDNKIMGVIGVAMDITNLKSAEERMFSTMDRYVKLVANSIDAIYMYDPSNLRILEANDAFFNLLGYDIEELGDLRVYDFIAHDKESIDYYLNNVISEESYVIGERKWRKKDNSLIDMYVSANKFSFWDQQYIFVVARDLTEMKRVQSEREEFQAQLIQSQKLESLGILAGGIAHDFNNILMGILSRASLTLRKIPQDSALKQDLELIENSAKKAASVIKQLLIFTGKNSVDMVNYNLSDLVKESESLLRITIPRNIEIQLNLSNSIPKVNIDRTQIQQILLNLVTNASEAIINKDGKILIETSNYSKSDHEIWDHVIGEFIENNYVCLSVIDNGSGIDHPIIKNIFDPFFSTKFTGRGLGLSVVNGITLAHKGVITVNSRIGSGTKFNILLPVSKSVTHDLNDSVQEEKEKEIEHMIKHRKVLVCDDDEQVLEIVKEMLTTMGFEVSLSLDGQSAIEKYNEDREISMIILDLTMPGLSGNETHKKLRELTTSLPIIIISGYNKENIADDLLSDPHLSFIQKPFTLDELEDKIQDFL